MADHARITLYSPPVCQSKENSSVIIKHFDLLNCFNKPGLKSLTIIHYCLSTSPQK